MKNILFISGSLRKESVNTKLLKAFEEAFPEEVSTTWANINLPLYNMDSEGTFPAEVQVLREQILGADLIFIATPEYNRGMSGALKNALDWTSRPSGQNAWSNKRTFVISSSTGALAGALAFYQVKQSLLHLNAEVISHPEFMVGRAPEKFDETGQLQDEQTAEYIKGAVEKLLS